jgi:hypothetical protein
MIVGVLMEMEERIFKHGCAGWISNGGVPEKSMINEEERKVIIPAKNIKRDQQNNLTENEESRRNQHCYQWMKRRQYLLLDENKNSHYVFWKGNLSNTKTFYQRKIQAK